MDNLENIKAKFRQMDNLLNEAEKEFNDIKKFEKKIKDLSKKVKALESFYHSDEWMNGREIIYKDGENTEYFYSAGEDSIYNLAQDFFYLKLKLIQQIFKDLM